jgi:hypothetical protein
MRKYVKSWVTQWDSLRFYPGEDCAVEVSTWKPSYGEQEEWHEVDGEGNGLICDSTSPPESTRESKSEEKGTVSPVTPAESAASVTSAL